MNIYIEVAHNLKSSVLYSIKQTYRKSKYKRLEFMFFPFYAHLQNIKFSVYRLHR